MQTNKTYFFAIRNIIVENKGVETNNFNKYNIFEFQLSIFVFLVIIKLAYSFVFSKNL